MGQLSAQEYQFLAKLLDQESGLQLGENKEYLLESRLMPLCQSQGFKSLSALIERLRANPSDSKLIKTINDLMTTNESLFFRDQAPFDLLSQKFLPEYQKSRGPMKELNIWSAATSTGQEPYSIAMTLLESKLSWSGWKVKILATDFCEASLERARVGQYSAHEVNRGMPADLLQKYFVPGAGTWTAKPILREMIEFRPHNLLQPLATTILFDIIFLRNVLIYFSNEKKSAVLQYMSRTAAKDGVLFLGGAETIYKLSTSWLAIEGIRAPIYRKA